MLIMHGYANERLFGGQRLFVAALLWHFVTLEAFPAASQAVLCPIFVLCPFVSRSYSHQQHPGRAPWSLVPTGPGMAELALSLLGGRCWARWHSAFHLPPLQGLPASRLPRASSRVTGLLATLPSTPARGCLFSGKNDLLDAGLENHRGGPFPSFV